MSGRAGWSAASTAWSSRPPGRPNRRHGQRAEHGLTDSMDMLSEHFAMIADALRARYRVTRLLQSGVSAYVYVAEDRASGMQVAIKVLRDEMTSTVSADRFHSEIEVARQLRHPNIVPMCDSGEIDGLPFYVMPFIEGETLRARLSRLGRIPLGDAMRIAEDVARALHFAHRHHVVHRDIKPENVMLERGRALVLDFGIALALTAIAGIVLGMGMPTTPSYIVMVSLLVPAVIKLGASTPAAHMFAFYFAILSAITPPVALAVFAAAGLAKTDLWRAGWEAVRVAAPAYIVPFMFVYEPSLLMMGDPITILTSSVSACIGVMCFAAGLQGYLLREARTWERVLLVIAAILLIKPGYVSDLVGLAVLGGLLLLNAARARSAARVAQK